MERKFVVGNDDNDIIVIIIVIITTYYYPSLKHFTNACYHYAMKIGLKSMGFRRKLQLNFTHNAVRSSCMLSV